MDPVENPSIDPAAQPAPPPVAVVPPVNPDANDAPALLDADGNPIARVVKPVQPRIDELTRAQHEAKREAEYWRRRAEAAEAPKPAAPAPKPVAADFDDYGAFVEALTDWKADQKIDAKLTERDTRSAEQRETETRVSNWQTREEKVRAAVPNYDAIMGTSTVPVTKSVETELLDDERGPEIALHLTLHPELADKLNRMDQRQAAREIGRLSGSLPVLATLNPAPEGENEGDEPPVTPVKPAAAPVKTTQAPPPPKPVGSGRSTTVPLEKLSMDDYVERRKAQGASWARR